MSISKGEIGLYAAKIYPVEGALIFGLLIFIFIVLLVFVPGIKRGIDGAGGEGKNDLRALVVCGSGAIRSGGGIYRLSLYDRYLVMALVSSSSYSYSDVEIVDGPWGDGRLVLLLCRVRMVIYGRPNSVDAFRRTLAIQVKSSAGRGN